MRRAVQRLTMRLRLSLVCAFAVCASAAVAAPSWKHYGNNRFGYTVDIPAGWQDQPPPDNGDGLSFLSPDGKAELAVYGRWVMENNMDGDAAEALTAFLAQSFEGDRVTYTQRGARTATVSGFTKDGHIFYRHSLLSCGAELWNAVEFDYPVDEKAALDPIIAHVVASLHSGIPFGSQCAD
jgi:hypothetical protein